MAELAYSLFMFGSVLLFLTTFKRWVEIANVLIRIGSSSFFFGTLSLWIGA